MQTFLEIVVDSDGNGKALPAHSVVGQVEGQEERLEGRDGGHGGQTKTGKLTQADGVTHPLRDGVGNSATQLHRPRFPALHRHHQFNELAVLSHFTSK